MPTRVGSSPPLCKLEVCMPWGCRVVNLQRPSQFSPGPPSLHLCSECGCRHCPVRAPAGHRLAAWAGQGAARAQPLSPGQAHAGCGRRRRRAARVWPRLAQQAAQRHQRRFPAAPAAQRRKLRTWPANGALAAGQANVHCLPLSKSWGPQQLAGAAFCTAGLALGCASAHHHTLHASLVVPSAKFVWQSTRQSTSTG